MSGWFLLASAIVQCMLTLSTNLGNSICAQFKEDGTFAEDHFASTYSQYSLLITLTTSLALEQQPTPGMELEILCAKFYNLFTA